MVLGKEHLNLHYPLPKGDNKVKVRLSCIGIVIVYSLEFLQGRGWHAGRGHSGTEQQARAQYIER